MKRILAPIAAAVAAAALSACAAPRAVLMPAPPQAMRKEAGAPAPAAAERTVPSAGKPASPPPEAVPGAKGAAASPSPPIPAPAEPIPDALMLYADACDRTQGAIARGTPGDAITSWTVLEDSKWGTDAIYNQGVLFQLVGNIDAAAARYARAVERSPGFEPALANLLGISLLRGDKAQMKSVLARAVPAGSPPSPQMLPELAVNAAGALLETGRRDDAAAILRNMRDRGRMTPGLAWNLAVLSFRNGDPAAARELSDKVPASVANLFPVVVSRFAWAREGENMPDLGPVPPAMAGMAVLSANLAAYAAYRAGDVAGAETILAPSAAAPSVPAQLLTNIGMLHAEQGRWSDARRNLERAVRDDPDLAAAWLNLGVFREIYEGNLSGARECYDNYVKLGGWRKEEVRKWSERLGQSASPQQ